MIEYPFVKCLDPQVIRNKYTGKEMMVNCGKCEACVMRKGSMNTLKCQLESTQHLYAKFITLTYDEENVPRMHIESADKVISPDGVVTYLRHPWIYVENTPRLDGKECHAIYNLEDYSTHEMLLCKVENEDLPYLCKRDLQLFFKRLRKYYDKYSKKYNVPIGKIRYYACGEYGPVHFRPHYHIILWFSEDEINSSIAQAVSACWKFGRVSTETPRDDVSRYVAKYLNCSSYLPEVYKSYEIRPFSLHSQFLGEAIFAMSKEEIYTLPIEEIVRRSVFVADTYSDVYMWRSLKTRFFPRCKGFDTLSPQERMYSYIIMEQIPQFIKGESISDITRNILEYLYNCQLPYWSQFSEHPDYNDFFRFIIDKNGIDIVNLRYYDEYNRAFRSVYMMLRTSRYFLSYCCEWDMNRVPEMIRKIEDFYSSCEYLNLKSQYQQLEQFSDDMFDDVDNDYDLCFTLFPSEIKKTRIYKQFRADTLNRFHNSMKHKKLNDANRIYINKK